MANKGGGAYGIHEPHSEYLRVIDPFTGGIIYCVNRLSLRTPKWIERFLIGGTNVPLLDVTKTIPVNNTMSFTHDSFVDNNKTRRYVELLVDYACLMHSHLEQHGSVVVHCKNGRSRSPTVILAFFMLRGIGRTHAIAFLEEAFQIQRPTIALRSPAFPNFAKFDNVTLNLAMALEETWLVERLQSNFGVLSSTSSSSSSSSSSSAYQESYRLDGRPWDIPFTVPTQWKNVLPAFPPSSFCRPSTSYGGSSDKRSTNNNTNSSSRRPSSLRRKQRQKTLPPDPNVHTAGRYVKILVPSQQSSSSSSSSSSSAKQISAQYMYQLGTLREQITLHEISYWDVVMEDGTEKRILEENVIPAFSKGTRVSVNWEFEGEIFDGVVMDWKGGLHCSVWFDGEKKAWKTSGAEISLCTKDLLDSCHPKVRKVVESNPQLNVGRNISQQTTTQAILPEQLINKRQLHQHQQHQHKLHTQRQQKQQTKNKNTKNKKTKNQKTKVAKKITGKKRKMSNRSKDTMKALKLQSKRGNKQQGKERKTVQKKRKVTSEKKNEEYSGEEELSNEEEESLSEAEREAEEELTRNPHQQKLQSNNTTGFKGVTRNRNKYQAKIRIDGTQTNLGSFDTTTKAALAYDRAVIQNKFPSSWLNFVHNEYSHEDDVEEVDEAELTRNPHQNIPPNNTTGFKGVTRNENKYKAQIKIDGTNKSFGTFDTTTKAALAYDRAVIQNKFPSSWLNFVHSEYSHEDDEEEEVDEEELTRNPQQQLSSWNTTGFKGVRQRGNKYAAQISIGSTSKHLGTFEKITKAALAFDRAVIHNKLPSSYLNFVQKRKKKQPKGRPSHQQLL